MNQEQTVRILADGRQEGMALRTRMETVQTSGRGDRSNASFGSRSQPVSASSSRPAIVPCLARIPFGDRMRDAAYFLHNFEVEGARILLEGSAFS